MWELLVDSLAGADESRPFDGFKFMFECDLSRSSAMSGADSPMRVCGVDSLLDCSEGDEMRAADFDRGKGGKGSD